MKKQLREYPTPGDFFLEYEQQGIGTDCPQHLKLSNGGEIVYMNQKTSPGFQDQPSRTNIIIAGYYERRVGLSNWFNGRRIQPIPEGERKQVESELRKKFDNKNISDITFWTNN